MGLGALSVYSLSEARERTRMYKQLLDQGIDPIEHRKASRQANLAASAQRKTFQECALEYHQLHAHGWKNTKHADQWINTLSAYAFSKFGAKDVSLVSKADILGVLEPIWTTKPETASRVRQRIRVVLDWAAARDYRINHDAHIWDQVSRSLPNIKDIKKPKHFSACPYADINRVLASIKNSSSNDTIKLAMEFLILTAARSGEVRAAVWSEIDFKNHRWVIPAERMKAGREHRVPLSPRAIEILKQMHRVTDTNLIFPGSRNKCLSDMTFTMALRRVGYDYTVHGFRSTFRDWAAEQTSYPRDVCEAALAHANKDTTEAAYFRSDLFEKRREMMKEWQSYVLTSTTANSTTCRFAATAK